MTNYQNLIIGGGMSAAAAVDGIREVIRSTFERWSPELIMLTSGSLTPTNVDVAPNRSKFAHRAFQSLTS
jgi:hypothetical protein